MFTLPKVRSPLPWHQQSRIKRWASDLFALNSRKSSYRLQIGGDKGLAWVIPELRRVYLSDNLPFVDSPYIRFDPVNTDARIEMILTGLIAHEAGHVRHSTGGLPGKIGELSNCIEDERIERLMAAEYPDLAPIFTYLGDTVCEKRRAKWSYTAMEGVLTWRFEHDRLIPRWKPRREDRKLWEKEIRPRIEAGWAATNSAEVDQLASEIYALIKAHQNELDQKGPPPAQTPPEPEQPQHEPQKDPGQPDDADEPQDTTDPDTEPGDADQPSSPEDESGAGSGENQDLESDQDNGAGGENNAEDTDDSANPNGDGSGDSLDADQGDDTHKPDVQSDRNDPDTPDDSNGETQNEESGNSEDGPGGQDQDTGKSASKGQDTQPDNSTGGEGKNQDDNTQNPDGQADKDDPDSPDDNDAGDASEDQEAGNGSSGETGGEQSRDSEDGPGGQDQNTEEDGDEGQDTPPDDRPGSEGQNTQPDHAEKRQDNGPGNSDTEEEAEQDDHSPVSNLSPEDQAAENRDDETFPQPWQDVSASGRDADKRDGTVDEQDMARGQGGQDADDTAENQSEKNGDEDKPQPIPGRGEQPDARAGTGQLPRMPVPDHSTGEVIAPGVEGHARIISRLLKPLGVPAQKRPHRSKGRYDYNRHMRGDERIFVKKTEATRPMPLTVKLLVDVSYSMNGARIDAARSAALMLVRAAALCGASVHVHLFNDEHLPVIVEPMPYTEAAQIISAIGIDGSTLLSKALQTVCNEPRIPHEAEMIVVICDGELLTHDYLKCEHIVKTGRKHGLYFLPVLIGEAALVADDWHRTFGSALVCQDVDSIAQMIKASLTTMRARL